MKQKLPIMLLGVPVFGGWLPYIGRRHIPLNRDGSPVESDGLIEEGCGFYFVKPFVVEWLGYGRPLTRSYVFRTDTGEIVNNPEFDTAG